MGGVLNSKSSLPDMAVFLIDYLFDNPLHINADNFILLHDTFIVNFQKWTLGNSLVVKVF
jgi:hypothetical protein